MSFFKKIKTPIFWIHFSKITIPFFIFLTIITLLWKHWNQVFAGDFEVILKENFENGKWKAFFGVKIIASVLYGLYITHKNMK